MSPLNNNRISLTQRNLDLNLQVNPIEDGNSSNDIPQGYLATSEIDAAGYDGAFSGYINEIISERPRTGNDNYFKIKVVYQVDDYRNGWFGSNLIKEGDPFMIDALPIISSFNPLRGYIVNVINFTEYKGSQIVYECIYELLCCITEGDLAILNPSNITYFAPGYAIPGYTITGQRFNVNRRIFNYENLDAPNNLQSTFVNGKNVFFWNDPTNTAVAYKLSLRLENNTQKNIFNVVGNSPTFNGELQPLLSYTNPDQLGAVKIVNPGYSFSAETKAPVLVTTGTPPQINMLMNKCGAVDITEWIILDSISLSTHSTVLRIKLVGKNPEQGLSSLFQPGGSYYTDFQHPDIGDSYTTSGTLVDGNVYDVDFQLFESAPPIFHSGAPELIGKKIKIHTGIGISNRGSGLTKPPKVVYDKYLTTAKYALFWPFAGTYYWSVASIFDCNQKTFSEWSQEEKLIIQ